MTLFYRFLRRRTFARLLSSMIASSAILRGGR